MGLHSQSLGYLWRGQENRCKEGGIVWAEESEGFMGGKESGQQEEEESGRGRWGGGEGFLWGQSLHWLLKGFNRWRRVENFKWREYLEPRVGVAQMQGRCGVQRGEDGRTKGINLGEKGLAESRSLCRDQESSGASDVACCAFYFCRGKWFERFYRLNVVEGVGEELLFNMDFQTVQEGETSSHNSLTYFTSVFSGKWWPPWILAFIMHPSLEQSYSLIFLIINLLQLWA